MVKISILFFLGAFACLAVDAQSMRTSEEEAVWQADDARAQAALTNDVDEILSFYDQDAVFTGTTPPTIGQDALHSLWDVWVSRTDYQLLWQVELVSVSPSGDFAFSSGTFEQSYLRDGQRQHDSGNYWAVWKKQDDGAWKVVVDQP